MKTVKKLIIEIITVTIGILIALYINNWNDKRKESIYLNQIYSSIQKELRESTEDIKMVIPKHQATVDTINIYLNNDQVSLYDLMVKANGIHAPNIKTTAWNAVANSKIELIEHERLSSLVDIEERKKT